MHFPRLLSSHPITAVCILIASATAPAQQPAFASVQPEVIKLTYADAQKVATSVDEILKLQSVARPGSGEDGDIAQIQAITRTNSIRVFCRPEDLPFIRKLAETHDVPRLEGKPIRRKLKYLPIGDLMPVVADALSRHFGEKGGDPTEMPEIDFFDAYVRALEQTGRCKVISRPFIFNADKRLSSIELNVPGAVLTDITSDTEESGAVPDPVTFPEEVLLELDVAPLIGCVDEVVLHITRVGGGSAFRLDVTPLIHSADEMTLTISLEDEMVTSATVIGRREVSYIGVRQLETSVRLPDNAIVIPLGIVQGSEGDTGKPRKETIVLLQPRIIDADDDLVEKDIQEIREAILGDRFDRKDLDQSKLRDPRAE